MPDSLLSNSHLVDPDCVAFSVGVDSIDDDHKALFRLGSLIRDLQDYSSENRESQDVVMESALNMLEETIVGHFLREEKAMAAANYSELSEHVAVHKNFANEIRRITQDYRSGNRSVVVQLPGLLIEWISNHHITMDSMYCGFLSNENVDDRALPYLMNYSDAEEDQ